MSTFIGKVRHSVWDNDCDIVAIEADSRGMLHLNWRNPDRYTREMAQQELDDLVTVIQRVARQNGLVWPKEGK